MTKLTSALHHESRMRRTSIRAIARPVLAATLIASAGQACAALRRPPYPVDRTHDERIARELTERLAAEPSLAADELRVEVDGGVVVLHGSVVGMGAWRCAIRNAELVSGVRTVVDYLVLERGPREVQCLAARTPGQ